MSVFVEESYGYGQGPGNIVQMERLTATPTISTKDLRSWMHQLRQVEFHKRIVVQEQQVQRPL